MANEKIVLEIDVKGNAGEQIDAAAKSTQSLRAELRQLTQELQGLDPGSDKFNELTSRAGQLRDTIGDTNSAINATAGNTTQNLGGAFTSLAGVGISAFQGIASAQALFGGESQEVTKVLLKLQALAGLSDAVKSLGGLKDTMTGVKAAFAAAFAQSTLFNSATVAQAVATGTATTAQKIMNVVMAANPVMLLVVAIGALVAAFMIFGDSAEDAKKQQEKLNAEVERGMELTQAAQESTSSLIAANNRDIETNVANLKLKGATQDEIFAAEKDGLELNLAFQQNATDVALREYNKVLNAKKSTMEQFDKAEKALNAARAKSNELSHQLEMKLLNQQVQAGEDARKKEEEALEKRRQAAAKFAADKKAAQDKIRAIEIDYQDKLLSDVDAELAANKRKYDELFAIAKKYNLDATTLKLSFESTNAEISKKFADEETKRLEDFNQKQIDVTKAGNDAFALSSKSLTALS